MVSKGPPARLEAASRKELSVNVIETRGLTKRYRRKLAVDNLDMTVAAGDIYGFVGKNGAGKTTLFRILTGELDYDAGEVSIASGRRLGLISQIPVYPELQVEDVLKSAFSRMQRMEDEMNALSQQMASGDESEETLRRYGELRPSLRVSAATTPRRPSTRLQRPLHPAGDARAVVRHTLGR